MKGSIVTSIALHGLLLAYVLLSFGAPDPFEVTMSEALPVELVPIEDMTQIQQGDKEAPKKEDSAKDVTQREDTVPEAQNSGENDFDLKTVPTPMQKPDNVQKAGAPEKSEVVAQEKAETPVDVTDIIKEAQVQPTEELAAEAQPKAEVKPATKPVAEPTPAEPVETAEELPLPDTIPLPESRPEIAEAKPVEEKKEEKKTPEKEVKKAEKPKKDEKPVEVAEAKTAKTQERKKTEQTKKTAKTTTSKDSDFNTQSIDELLNKVDSEAGGAKRNKKTKAFGGEKATGGQKLSQDELNALKGLIEKNWSIMPGQVTSDDIVITVRMQLDQGGEIVGDLKVSSSGGDESARNVLERSAARAVKKSAPFDQLPKDKYETWSEVVVNFSPSELM